jgi:hypothetical protein
MTNQLKSKTDDYHDTLIIYPQIKPASYVQMKAILSRLPSTLFRYGNMQVIVATNPNGGNMFKF